MFHMPGKNVLSADVGMQGSIGTHSGRLTDPTV